MTAEYGEGRCRETYLSDNYILQHWIFLCKGEINTSKDIFFLPLCLLGENFKEANSAFWHQAEQNHDASALLQWQVFKGEGLSSKASDFMDVSCYDRVPCRVCVKIPLQDLSGVWAAFYFFLVFFLGYLPTLSVVGNPSTWFLWNISRNAASPIQ